MSNQTVDVCILGGGMAGLTLARQLHQRRNDLSITVVEHRQFPLPEAAHKVGESTVEIAAHYLANVLDLKSHLESQQLPKFGLRLFLRGAEPITDDLSVYDEIGVSRVLPVPTYQVDRGRLENHLVGLCADQNTTILDASTVRKVVLDKGQHRVVVGCAQGEVNIRARYIVDASGRRGLLRQQLDLARPARHSNHAVWCRVSGELDLDSWSKNTQWQARCPDTPRRLSTNHFTGPGYWLWLIPLASGATSIGLVFDPKYVELQQVSRYERLVNWLHAEHPLVAGQLPAGEPMDFHVMRDYAKSSKELFSPDGWMISGDAGLFADPFYSPGADFIAFSNLFITDLICENKDADAYARFQSLFMSLFSNTLSLYRGQYGGFGHRDMMLVKTIWDYSYYWGPLSKLFFSGRCVDQKFMASQQDILFHAAKLNAAMQRKFRAFSTNAGRVGGTGQFFDHHELDYFHQLKHELLLGDNPNVASQLRASVQRLEDVAAHLGKTMSELEHGGHMVPLGELNQASAFR